MRCSGGARSVSTPRGCSPRITFININPVLFLQYFLWLTPFFPLAASEAFLGSKTTLAFPAADHVGVATPEVGSHEAPDGIEAAV